jgi:hypothetical protein
MQRRTRGGKGGRAAAKANARLREAGQAAEWEDVRAQGGDGAITVFISAFWRNNNYNNKGEEERARQ